MAHKFEAGARYKFMVAVAIKIIKFTGLIRNTCILKSPGGCYSSLLREHKRPVHSYLTNFKRKFLIPSTTYRNSYTSISPLCAKGKRTFRRM